MSVFNEISTKIKSGRKLGPQPTIDRIKYKSTFPPTAAISVEAVSVESKESSGSTSSRLSMLLNRLIINIFILCTFIISFDVSEFAPYCFYNCTEFDVRLNLWFFKIYSRCNCLFHVPMLLLILKLRNLTTYLVVLLLSIPEVQLALVNG